MRLGLVLLRVSSTRPKSWSNRENSARIRTSGLRHSHRLVRWNGGRAVTSDARIAAWIGAWQCLENIDRHRREAMKRRVELDADYLGHAVAAAAVYAQLAQASTAVGIAAGEWMQEQEKSRIEHGSQIAEMLARREKTAKKGDEDAADS